MQNEQKFFSEAVRRAIEQRDSIATRVAKLDASHNIHHIIPVEALINSRVVQDAVDAGFDFNGPINGISLPRYSSHTITKDGKVVADNTGTHSNHPNYTRQVMAILADLQESIMDYTPAKAKIIVEIVAKAIREQIKANPTTKLNDLIIKIL